ncbi:uncharacterized protein LOC111088894 isoform X2 [Limulus polyphemus]|uniref:Uncharacterized protein LOC111088894 isoform X2 n=1 Tax=Limulus polyphemus TaxID=6850 RepID=A0ABM1TIX8_LIMPO|nr:uncharacterized protein LOC111088894 isoform X2 [Limulus polyphemus]
MKEEEQCALFDNMLVKNEDETLKLTSTTGEADSLEERFSCTILKFGVAKEGQEKNDDVAIEKMENIFVRVKTEQPGDVPQDEIISKFSDNNDDDLDSSSYRVLNVKTETEFEEDLQQIESRLESASVSWLV